MENKIRNMLNILLMPFNDLELYNDEKFLSDLKNNNSKLTYYISDNSNNKNLDEIVLILRKYYSISNIKNINDLFKKYYDNLESIATSFVSHRNGKIVYKYWENDIDNQFIGPYENYKKVEVFRILNTLISTDLFVIIYLVKNNFSDITQLNGIYSNIVLADSQLYSLLNRGVAENHFHGNSGFNFLLLWEEIINGRISRKDIEGKDYLNVGYGKFKEKPAEYLILARVIRTLMLLYLKEQSFEETLTLNKFIEKTIDMENKSFFQYLNNDGLLDEESFFNLKKIIEVLNKKFDIKISEEKEDIVFEIFKEAKGIKTFGENIFLFKAFAYYEESKDEFFFSLLLKYLKIKNEFYKQIVQSNQLKGLDNFSNIFLRSTSFMGNLGLDDKSYYKKLFRAIFQNEHLKRIELRFGTHSNETIFKKNFISLITAYKEILEEDFKVTEENNVDFPRIGIVFHLKKFADKNLEKKCWVAKANGGGNHRIFFGDLQNSYFKEIKNLVKLRNELPYNSYFIVGLDAANIENATPVNVMAPIYKSARGSKEDSLVGKTKSGDFVNIKSLCYTFHAGEDFRHLISGLRRVSEVITHCKFHSGDRIGHGTVLGLDIERWLENNPVVIIPRGEHLDNLLWVWGIYSKSISKNVAINLFLENEIYKLAKEIYINISGINIPMMYEAYQLKFKELDEVNLKVDILDENIKSNELFCTKVNESDSISWTAEKLVYSNSCSCYSEGINASIYIQSNDIYKEIIEEVRDELIKELSIKGIVVEVNPSSNTFIGDMDNIFENQAYFINNLNDIENKNVMMNINSDNPMLLNTTVSNEYAYLYYGLLNKSVGREKALEWIDKQRKAGMETSFLDKTLSNQEYYKYLLEILKTYS